MNQSCFFFFSLLSVHFIGITLVSLQKNLAHTLGRRPLEGSSVKQATVRGVGGGPARKKGLGSSTGESGGGGRCAHRGRHTPRGVPSRTKVPLLDRSGRPPLPLGRGCESNGSFKVWSRKEKKGK